jgi:hypothetical protein
MRTNSTNMNFETLIRWIVTMDFSFRIHLEFRPTPCGNKEGDAFFKESVENDRCRISRPDMALQCLKECGF